MIHFLIFFLLFVIVGSLIINGWHEVTRKGQIFGFWEGFWERHTQVSDESPLIYKFPHAIRNPLSACIMCMASIYGSVIFWAFYYFHGTDIFWGHYFSEVILTWLAYLLSLVPINYIIHKKLK